jgi:hypothetical protein
METAVPTDQPSAAPPPAGRSRSNRSNRDMALSMAALLIPIFVLVGVYRFFFSGDAPIRVDASQTYATARHDGHFPILEPTGLPGGWTVSSSAFSRVSDGSVLRVGYLAPSHSGLQLVESDRPVNSLLPAELGATAQPGNLVTIAGKEWRSYPVARDGDTAMVLAENGQTTVVIGTVSATDMRIFVTALH